MNLHVVTMTGADDTTRPEDLAALSREFPFVEWGLLLNTAKNGSEPRFPTLAHLQQIAETAKAVPEMRLAVHLCGELARAAAEGKRTATETALELVPGAKRIQVNLGKTIKHYPTLFTTLQKNAEAFGITAISQTPNFTNTAVQAARGRRTKGNVVFLHDASGGHGISGEFEKPINDDFVGFAGGINAENVEEKLEQIMALGFRNPFWIDMESGVRTDDVFDLDKVEYILHLVKPHVSAVVV